MPSLCMGEGGSMIMIRLPIYKRIARIKESVDIPVIANGDIADEASLKEAIEQSGCDAYMISRAGSGKPWLYQELLSGEKRMDYSDIRAASFNKHLQGLAKLEGEYKAVLQSKTLIRYYYRSFLDSRMLLDFYALTTLAEIEQFIRAIMK